MKKATKYSTVGSVALAIALGACAPAAMAQTEAADPAAPATEPAAAQPADPGQPATAQPVAPAPEQGGQPAVPPAQAGVAPGQPGEEPLPDSAPAADDKNGTAGYEWILANNTQSDMDVSISKPYQVDNWKDVQEQLSSQTDDGVLAPGDAIDVHVEFEDGPLTNVYDGSFVLDGTTDSGGSFSGRVKNAPDQLKPVFSGSNVVVTQGASQDNSFADGIATIVNVDPSSAQQEPTGRPTQPVRTTHTAKAQRNDEAEAAARAVSSFLVAALSGGMKGDIYANVKGVLESVLGVGGNAQLADISESLAELHKQMDAMMKEMKELGREAQWQTFALAKKDMEKAERNINTTNDDISYALKDPHGPTHDEVVKLQQDLDVSLKDLSSLTDQDEVLDQLSKAMNYGEDPVDTTEYGDVIANYAKLTLARFGMGLVAMSRLSGYDGFDEHDYKSQVDAAVEVAKEAKRFRGSIPGDPEHPAIAMKNSTDMYAGPTNKLSRSSIPEADQDWTPLRDLNEIEEPMATMANAYSKNPGEGEDFHEYLLDKGIPTFFTTNYDEGIASNPDNNANVTVVIGNDVLTLKDLGFNLVGGSESYRSFRYSIAPQLYESGEGAQVVTNSEGRQVTGDDRRTDGIFDGIPMTITDGNTSSVTVKRDEANPYSSTRILDADGNVLTTDDEGTVQVPGEAGTTTMVRMEDGYVVDRSFETWASVEIPVQGGGTLTFS
ncbi:MAG: hypothetical protein KDC39_03295 [Actinobacteria bacterium]|nr:hypothetical protein [Actinomycetota bacterium]